MSSAMSDSVLDKEIVYLAYRDVFKDKLAKLRKRGKVRRVVEQHKGYLHHKQVADSMDSEKTCRILGDLLAARLFESDSAAKATFPTLFSSGQLVNNTAMTVKCVEDSFENEHEHRTEISNDPASFLDISDIFDDHPTSNDTSLKSAQTSGQRIDKKSGRIQKPTRATTNQAGPSLFAGGSDTGSEEAVHRGIAPSFSKILPRLLSLTLMCLQTERKARMSQSRHAIGIKYQQITHTSLLNFSI